MRWRGEYYIFNSLDENQKRAILVFFTIPVHFVHNMQLH